MPVNRMARFQTARGNPYSPSAIYACYGSTFGTKQPLGADLVPSFVLSNAAKLSARKAIVELLEFVSIPIPLRTIQAVLIFTHGFSPRSITSALRRPGIFEVDKIHLRRMPIYGKGTMATHVLCRWKPSEKHLRLIHAMLVAAREMVSHEELKHAGEGYVRRWLMANGFEKVTPTKQLGNVTISSTMSKRLREAFHLTKQAEHSLDAIATEVATGTQLAVSVKNQREWMFSGDRAIRDAFTKAKAHGREPMLFVPFPEISAIDRCREDGVRLEVMGAQIVPAEDRNKRPMPTVINDLRPVIGPQPYKFLPKRNGHRLLRATAVYFSAAMSAARLISSATCVTDNPIQTSNPIRTTDAPKNGGMRQFAPTAKPSTNHGITRSKSVKAAVFKNIIGIPLPIALEVPGARGSLIAVADYHASVIGPQKYIFLPKRNRV